MKFIIFNGNDVSLIFVIGLSFILALRFALKSTLSTTPTLLLVTFLSLTALNAIDNLLFWGDSLKYVAFSLSPWLPLSFSFASFAMGPVFYWFFRSLSFPEKHIRLRDYLQLFPAFAAPVFLYTICYRYGYEEQKELVINLSILSSAHGSFLVFLTLKKLLPLIYVVLSAKLISRNTFPQSTKSIYGAQIRYIHLGFGFIWLWVLLTHTFGQWLPVDVSDYMGIFGNYMTLTLLLSILFSNLGAVDAVAQPSMVESPLSAPSVSASQGQVSEEASKNILKQLEKAMESEKLFLNSQLTLERLSEHLNTPPRQLSYAINHHTTQNFHEYINRYRIEEAKRLLLTPECVDLTVLEIAYQSGFNSKATFNRIFKLMAGCSPSAYRQQSSNGLPPQNPSC